MIQHLDTKRKIYLSGATISHPNDDYILKHISKSVNSNLI